MIPFISTKRSDEYLDCDFDKRLAELLRLGIIVKGFRESSSNNLLRVLITTIQFLLEEFVRGVSDILREEIGSVDDFFV